MTSRFQVLDSIFSDTYRYPSLKELEVCSLVVTRTGRMKGGGTHERLCMDEQGFPERLYICKAL